MTRLQESGMERRDTERGTGGLLEPEDEDDQPGRDVIIMFAVFFEGGWPRCRCSWAGGWGTTRCSSSPGTSRTLSGERWPPLPLLWSSCGSSSAGRSARCGRSGLLRGGIHSPAGGKLLVGHGPDRALGRGRRGDALPRRAPDLAGGLAGDRLGPGRRQHPLRAAASDLDPLHLRHHGRGLLPRRGASC